MAQPTEGINVWCDWHGGPCSTGVLITIIERASGPSIPRYACFSCRVGHFLTPYSERDSLR